MMISCRCCRCCWWVIIHRPAAAAAATAAGRCCCWKAEQHDGARVNKLLLDNNDRSSQHFMDSCAVVNLSSLSHVPPSLFCFVRRARLSPSFQPNLHTRWRVFIICCSTVRVSFIGVLKFGFTGIGILYDGKSKNPTKILKMAGILSLFFFH
jgi:hypothetical protein